MKKCTAKLNSIGLGSRLVLAILIAMSLIPLSCERDKPLVNLDPCGPDGPPTKFTNQSGTMIYLEDVDRWAINFLPDCMASYVIDTNYIAIIGDYHIPDNLKVENKKVVFSGEIHNTDYQPDWSIFTAGTDFYDISLTAIEVK